MRELLWLSPAEALAAVIATSGMYLALVLIVAGILLARRRSSKGE